MSKLGPLLSLLADPTRVRLLDVLERQELGVGELVTILQLPQSTVSRHLKSLTQAGLLRRRADGASAWFRLSLGDLEPSLRQLWALVADEHRESLLHEEDMARLDGVLRARLQTDQSFFGREHARWEALRTELFGDRFLLPTLLALLPDDLTVLDVGCGTGEALAALAPFVRAVHGVDREQAMLDLAKRRTEAFTNVHLHRAALDELPLPDGAVTVATCMLVLHHAADPAKALAELRRVTRDQVLVLDMVAHDREDWRHTMGHAHLGFSESALTAHAHAAGLRVERRLALPPTPGAQGPPLFLAQLTKASQR